MRQLPIFCPIESSWRRPIGPSCWRLPRAYSSSRDGNAISFRPRLKMLQRGDYAPLCRDLAAAKASCLHAAPRHCGSIAMKSPTALPTLPRATFLDPPNETAQSVYGYSGGWPAREIMVGTSDDCIRRPGLKTSKASSASRHFRLDITAKNVDYQQRLRGSQPQPHSLCPPIICPTG